MGQPDNDNNNVIRPTLPRLRNKSSLGRLQVFGGVLDFQEAAAERAAIPAMPSLSHLLYSSMAGPSLPASLPLQPTQQASNRNSTMMQTHKQQHLHTPVKNTNNPHTLRELHRLDKKDERYPAALSNGRPLSCSAPSSIPGPDLDQVQPAQHKQHPSRRIRGEQHSHSRSSTPSSTSSHSREEQLTLLNSAKDVNVEDKNTRRRRRRRESEEEEEKERLVDEIRKDMDDGGYASLEQVSQPYIFVFLALTSLIHLLPCVI